jgi:hypothetical protein
MGLPQHRDTLDPERQNGFERREVSLRAVAAGQGIDHETDFMAARDLLAGEVEDMPEQTAEWRAKNVQDAQGAVWALENIAHAPDIAPDV